MILLNFFLLIVGFGLLIYGADSLVRGSSSIAKKVGLSPLFIGLTIVAFGTSLPELMVNIFASIKGSNDIAIGNVIGSNISNLLLILGVSAIIYPLAVKKTTVTKEIPFSLLAVVVIFVLANDFIIDKASSSILSRGDGIILLSFFIIFIYYTFGISKADERIKTEPIKTYNHYIALSMIIGGILGLSIGGNLLVDAAVTIARFFKVSEVLIGLTIVAIGTSLPELATSVVAAIKKSSDIAIGNIVGSNIFNIFWILGLSSVIKPISFSSVFNFDIIVVLLATFILIPFMFVGKRNILQRSQGITMVGFYIAYIIYLVIRG